MGVIIDKFRYESVPLDMLVQGDKIKTRHLYQVNDTNFGNLKKVNLKMKKLPQNFLAHQGEAFTIEWYYDN